MSKTKIHIDQLFAKGLENLELPVFSSDFEKIKEEVSNIEATPHSLFDNFELPVTDKDWQGIKERLEKEPNRTVVLLPTEYAQDLFKDFEIAVTDSDWKATKNKLESGKKKKMVWWWWLNMAILGLILGAMANYFKPLDSHSNIGVSIKNEINKASASVATTQASVENRNLSTPLPDNTASLDASKTKTEVLRNMDEKAKVLPSVTNNKRTNRTNKIANPSEGFTSHSKVINSTITRSDESDNSGTSASKSEPLKSELMNEFPQNNSIDKIIANTLINTEKLAPSEIDNTPKITVNEGSESISPIVPVKDSSKKETPKTTTTPPTGPPTILPQFYVGLVSDIDRTYRHLSNNNPSSYNTIRNNADKPITQFSYGFVAGIQKARNQFQMGVQMTSQNFTSNYNYVLQIQDSLALINPQSGLIGKFPIGKKRDTTITGNTHLIVKKVNIPFSYNRFWKLDGKTELMTGMSGILGINVKSSGNYLLNPANNQLYNFNYLKKAQNALSFSPGLSIGIQRKIGTSFLLQTNLAASYNVTNRFNQDFAAKQYPYSTNASKFNANEHLYSYGLSIKLLYLLH